MLPGQKVMLRGQRATCFGHFRLDLFRREAEFLGWTFGRVRFEIDDGHPACARGGQAEGCPTLRIERRHWGFGGGWPQVNDTGGARVLNVRVTVKGFIRFAAEKA